MKSAGRFYGIGVGPGDPELLTLKAARLLTEVDWVFLPAGSKGEPGFARTIIDALALDTTRFRPVTLGMSRQRDADLETYARAAADILAELRRGYSAAWITEGDPLLYSTFLHIWAELQRLEPKLLVEIVPGITSVQAAAARARVPIARLEECVGIVPAAYGLERLPQLLAEFATVFLLKVHKVFDQLLDRLAAFSGPLETFYVEKVGTAAERVVTDLATLRGQRLPYFSLVIVRRAPGVRHE